ncbi:MAG: hypothetical protein ABEH35_09040 [Haloarculaceae archaeon]
MASEGDIRVLLVLDGLLSLFFSYVIIHLLDLAGIGAFSWEKVAVGTVMLAAITYVVVLR